MSHHHIQKENSLFPGSWYPAWHLVNYVKKNLSIFNNLELLGTGKRVVNAEILAEVLHRDSPNFGKTGARVLMHLDQIEAVDAKQFEQKFQH